MKNLEVPNRSPNYAMTVLMVPYGCHVFEILNVELPDINWPDSSITVRQPKTGDQLYRRLTVATGNFLTNYVGVEYDGRNGKVIKIGVAGKRKSDNRVVGLKEK